MFLPGPAPDPHKFVDQDPQKNADPDPGQRGKERNGMNNS